MGDLPQKKRLKVIDDIKAGKLHLLVATDVAARGLDIEDLAMVVNYDLPNESENYVHRIGRTARAGKTGKAVTLASEQDVYALPGIERYIGQKIPSETATAELFAEDKSEGKHIHTEFYEERGHKTGGHRTAGHRSEGSADDRLRRKGSDSQRHGGVRHSRKDQHSPIEQRRGEKKSRAGEHGRNFQNPPGDFQNGVKLSELSLEERMAYYRQKYDKSVTAEGSSKKAEQKRPEQIKKEQMKTDHKKPKGASQRKQKKRKSAKPQQSAEHSVISPVAAVEQKAPKKGILTRFFDVFKKKEN
jgi:ATP-dependent RNA helicase RhlB